MDLFEISLAYVSCIHELRYDIDEMNERLTQFLCDPLGYIDKIEKIRLIQLAWRRHAARKRAARIVWRAWQLYRDQIEYCRRFNAREVGLLMQVALKYETYPSSTALPAAPSSLGAGSSLGTP